MSSTNRGSERRVDDEYYTPAWCVHRLKEAWQPDPFGSLVEPAVGGGAIVDALAPERNWFGFDVREVSPIVRQFKCCNFLKMKLANPDAVAVVTNPPYCLAEEFVRHSRSLYPRADLVFLLRLGFLASEGRLLLWKDLGTPNIYVLPNRPSFTGRGTDSADYAWYVWPGGVKRKEGDLRVLASTPKSVRCP